MCVNSLIDEYQYINIFEKNIHIYVSFTQASAKYFELHNTCADKKGVYLAGFGSVKK